MIIPHNLSLMGEVDPAQPGRVVRVRASPCTRVCGET